MKSIDFIIRISFGGKNAAISPRFLLKTFLAAILIGFNGLVSAQSFTIESKAIAGGGGTSTGGVYSVSGTIGQHDVGTMAGSHYVLQAGFWNQIGVIQTPGAPVLSLRRSNLTYYVSWLRPADGWVLQVTPVLAPPATQWSTVPAPYQTNSTSIFHVIVNPTGNQFYRLSK